MNKSSACCSPAVLIGLILSLMGFLASNGLTQTILTIDEAVRLAGTQSPAMKKSELQLKQSWYGYQSAKLQFWSTLEWRSTVPAISNDINRVSDPVTGEFYFVRQDYITYSSELSLTQPVIWTDADISIVGGFSQFRQTLNNTTETNYISDLRLRISQPLFTYNRRGHGLERAELMLEMSRKQYLTTQQDVLYRAKQAWFNWYRAEQSAQIAESELFQTRESLDLAQRKFDAGIIAEVDKLKLDVDFATANNVLLQRQTEAQLAENQLKIVLGIPLDQELVLPAGFETKAVSIRMDQVLAVALRNRPEIEDSKRRVRLQEMAVEETDARREFRADLNLEVGLKRQDPLLGQAFKDPNRTQQVSLSLTVPILDWGQNHAETQGQRAALEEERIDSYEAERLITNEILQLSESYRQSAERLKILERTVEFAQQSYDISYQKFRSGTLTSEELAQAQRRLTDAKTSVLSARMDYQLSIAALNRACLYDWERNTDLNSSIPAFD